MKTASLSKAWVPGYEGIYYATEDGFVWRVWKNRTPTRLEGYKKDNLWAIKLLGKEYVMSRVIWESFKGRIPANKVITRRNKILSNNSLYNLKCVNKSDRSKKTGAMSKSRSVEQLDENRNVINSWTSARKAAIDLHMSYQTVADYCNRKVKRPMVHLRWESKGNQ
ncbi:MAG: HNH endonuclease [Streptococcaceae bacterium]|jgi:hypothetical protein|nr:HNH endonuclease [Streptococcaceae bacterium]